MRDYQFRELCDSLTEMNETQLETIIQKAQAELQSRRDASASQFFGIVLLLGIIALLIIF